MIAPSEPQTGQAKTRRVLVVGGSTGIGLAIAEEFARHGHDLILVARNGERLARTVALVRSLGVEADGIVLDAASHDGARRLVGALDDAGFSLSFVIVGIGRWLSGRIEATDMAALRSTLDANVAAPVQLLQALLPRIPSGGGVLCVGSLAGTVPLPGIGAYASSKAALHAAVLALRQEVRPRGIKVCVLAPGLVATDFMPRPADPRKGRWMGWLASTPETVAYVAYRGFLSDRPVIVPGLFWRGLWIGMRLVPGVLVAGLTRRFFQTFDDVDSSRREPT